MSLIDDFLHSSIDLTYLITIAVIVGVGYVMGARSVHVDVVKRLAYVSYLGLVSIHCYEYEPNTFEDLISILLRSMFQTLVLVGIGLIVLPAFSAMLRLRQRTREGLDRLRTQRATRRAKRVATKAPLPISRRELTAEEIAEQEQQRQQQEAIRQREAEQKRLERARREELRLECELLYDRYSLELSDRFPRQQFESYFDRFLADSQTLEAVEKRGAMLLEMIHQCLCDIGKPTGRATPESIAEVAAFFDEQRQQLRLMEFDPDALESLIATINAEEDKALMETMANYRRASRK